MNENENAASAHSNTWQKCVPFAFRIFSPISFLFGHFRLAHIWHIAAAWENGQKFTIEKEGLKVN
jgi:hypothetical protein